MTPERWKKIEDIFQEALDCPAAEREKFIAEKTGGDEELRREVEKLVARIETDENFLESPVWTDSLLLQSNFKREIASSLEEIAPSGAYETLIGKQIGVYRLVSELGRGGMGMVFSAERADGEFHQKVAVKLIKRGMDTDFIVQRFRHERQILATLNHPNIARLLDGGTTDDGLPYFVMEFIEGAPFFKYCDTKNLNLRQKLELFLAVCSAVSYAHKRKIIHRDIKPGNILVTEEGAPKLLDFGIAKILDPELIHESIAPTATAMRLMTPEYASPEQVTGDEITAASDQYSLGVLLYESITGSRPYKFPSRAPHEIARVICEEEPSQPLVERTNAFSPQDTSLLNDESFAKLDLIVLKSLRKNPAERFSSVEEFAAEIESFLKNTITAVQSAAKTNNQFNRLLNEEKTSETDSAQTTPRNFENKTVVETSREKTISPRWRGIKQGIFILILSLLSIPIFLLITVAAVIPPPIVTAIFIAFFLAGFVRILYALLFESGQRKIAATDRKAIEIAEAQTKLATLPREKTTGKIEFPEEKIELEKSIAVLPFKNLNPASGDTTGGSEFLSVGLADALITRISNVRRLIVRPTSSVLKFGAGNTNSLDAAKELNVRFVVEGNIVKTENRIRVSVQLLDVENRSTVWAEKFDEDLTDYLDLEDSISARVVASLLPKVSGEDQKQLEKRGTQNAAAYEAYLRGRYHFNFYTDEGFQTAIAFYEKAVKLDPFYALAYAAIADYYVWQSVYDVNPVSPKAKESALKAIALDARLSEAYAALGLATLYGDYDWKTSEENIRRAIELNPNNSVAHLWYAHCLLTQKRFTEGTRRVARALELDPLSYLNHNTFSWSFYFQRRYDEALKLNDEVLASYPRIAQAHFSRGSFLDKLGKPEEAMRSMRHAQKLEPESLFVLYGIASAFAAAGKRREAEDLIEEIKAKSKGRFFSNYQTAIIYCYLNEVDIVFEYLEKAFEHRDSLLVWLAVEPSLDPIRSDKRYQKLLKKLSYPLTD